MQIELLLHTCHRLGAFHVVFLLLLTKPKNRFSDLHFTDEETEVF